MTNVIYEGKAKPLELDFAKYGLKLYEDEMDVYLPLAMLSSMMNDIAG